jgi:hypothetical protein
MLAFVHEIGHNFNSEHTQCYNPPVDECRSCRGNKRSCPNSQGAATIMSYCHLCSGGYDNVAYTFGGYKDDSSGAWVPDPSIYDLGFSYLAERVPQTMYQHAQTRENSCLSFSACTMDSHCDDGLYCNGVETCNTASGTCESGTNPCAVGKVCDESSSSCEIVSTCTTDAECNDSLYCTGAETCDAGVCGSAGNPCAVGEVCDESASTPCVHPNCAIYQESCKKTQCCDGYLCYVGYPGGPQCR